MNQDTIKISGVTLLVENVFEGEITCETLFMTLVEQEYSNEENSKL